MKLSIINTERAHVSDQELLDKVTIASQKLHSQLTNTNLRVFCTAVHEGVTEIENAVKTLFAYRSTLHRLEILDQGSGQLTGASDEN